MERLGIKVLSKGGSQKVEMKGWRVEEERELQ
jgi:hypothetical protein